jgi:hypothetical protein
MIKSSRLYDVLKFVALILLPATGTLYFTLAGIWDLPKAQEVVNTIIAVDTFLGVILQLSNAKYSSKKVGVIKMNETDESALYSLELDGDPAEIADHDEVRFSVDTIKKNRTKKKPQAKAARHRTGST